MATVRGEATATIGGKDYLIRLDWESIANIEEEFDRPIGKIFADPQMRHLFFTAAAGLKYFDRTMTTKKLSGLIETKEVKPLIAAVTKAVGGLLGDLGEGESEEPGPTENSTGTNSSEQPQSSE